MEGKSFSIGAFIKAGWNAMRAHLGFFIGFLLLSALIPMIPYAIAYGFFGYEHLEDTRPILHFFIGVAHTALAVMVGMGLLKVSLDVSSDQQPQWSSLFAYFPKIIHYFIAQLFYIVIVVVGLVLFIFPGVIWGLRYFLYGYFIVDKGAGPIEALKMSAKATMGAKWDLLGLVIVSILINILGFLCLIVGLFATIPTVVVANALVYRKLVAATSF